jgi:hypothetical protein
MPWVVGIDEAGYGPNLGPLVQAAVALHLPDDDPDGWETLRPVVRRCGEKADGRLLVDDSKKVYARGGFAALERGVFSGIGLAIDWFSEFVEGGLHLPGGGADVAAEGWYDGDERVPIADWEWPASGCLQARMLCRVVPAPRFNRVVDESGSKATVLAGGLVELLGFRPTVDDSTDGEPLVFVCDKQGGRNFYGPLLREAFPTGWVVPERESAEESRYRVELLDRPVTVTFRPRADGDSVSVALASMLCKYLREVCMRQFNRFWEKHVPGIKPTAGYPVDAKRFFAEIKPAMAKLGLADDQVRRKR